MNFWLTLLCAAAVIVLFPYIRCFFKRLECAAKIKKLCRGNRCTLHPTHPLWFLGGKRTKKCDVYLETESTVFAVKLFGMRRRLSTLVITDKGEYITRSYVAFISHGGGFSIPINGKPHLLPKYDFRYRYKDEWETKSPRNILLVNPVSMDIRRLTSGKDIILGAGEVMFGMEIFSLTRFLGEAEASQ